MAFNVVNHLGTGTDAELLELARAAIARITVFGMFRTTDGRTLNEANLTELRKQVTWLEGRIAAASSSSGRSRTVIGRRNRAQ